MSDLLGSLKKWYLALPFGLFCAGVWLFCSGATAAALKLVIPSLPSVLFYGIFLLFALPPLLFFSVHLFSFRGNRQLHRRLHTLSSLFFTSYLYLLLCIGSGTALGVFLALTGILPFGKTGALVFLLFTAGLFLLIELLGSLMAKRTAVRRILYPPASAEGSCLRIAFLSDLHFGSFTELRQLRRIFSLLQREAPQLLLLGGDLFDFSFDDLRPAAREEILRGFRALAAQIPCGIYACEGNHDRCAMKNDPRVEEFLKDCGIVLLRDEGVLLETPAGRFWLVGRKDFRTASEEKSCGRRKSAGELLADRPQNLPCLVLDHRPKEIPALAAAGAELVLCGHVHGGQTFPGNLLHRLISKYYYGAQTCGGCFSYTTSGCGRPAPPMRLFTSDEIVILLWRPSRRSDC